jgi:NAD(P)-dependent dehydrogenase (short-subunit alcohol dehydrogenase family)
MSGELEGKVALVTGGAQGIGRSIALTLAGRGARVTVVDVKDEGGAATAEECGGMYVHADVAAQAEVEDAVARTIDGFGALSILVNNAGITKFIDFFEIDAGLWDTTQAVNLRSMFFFMRAAARHMRDHGGGSIVNISSMAAKGYRHTSSAAYASSKGGVLGLTRAAAMQLARYSIRVNAVSPGIVITPLNAKWLADNPARIEEIPLGRPCYPEDIAAAVAFLGSDAAGTITGQSLNVDGGLTID